MTASLLRLTAVLAGALAASWFLAEARATPLHPVLEAQAVLDNAATAYREGDYERAAGALERAAALNPASLRTRYNLACTYALTGRHEEALDLLGRLVQARVDYGIAREEDFAALRSHARFQRLLAELEERLAPVSTSERLFTLKAGIIPEGIAYDEATGRTFVGSMRTGEVYAVSNDGEAAPFAALDEGRRLAALGLRVDARRHLLWSVGAPLDVTEGQDAASGARSAVFGFDLESGILEARYEADPALGNLEDLVIAPDGSLYLSGERPGVLRAGGEVVEPLRTDPAIVGGNGIALSADGGTLFVASYPVGIAAVHLESGAARFLASPSEQPLYGIDGLYVRGNDLIVVQNGVTPWRLVRLSLDAGLTAITGARLLEFAHPDIVTATTG
jgi:sugar lactone lactonase YvrE